MSLFGIPKVCFTSSSIKQGSEMSFPVLQMGSHGQDVRKWQKFLSRDQGIELDFDSMALDGIFGVGTTHGTKTYQASKGLNPSGIVDSATYVQAVEDGFDSTINV